MLWNPSAWQSRQNQPRRQGVQYKAASGVATIAKAVSGSSHSEQPIGHGQGSRLAKILRGGSRGLKIKRETAGIRDVMASFFKHFGTDVEAC